MNDFIGSAITLTNLILIPVTIWNWHVYFKTRNKQIEEMEATDKTIGGVRRMAQNLTDIVRYLPAMLDADPKLLFDDHGRLNTLEVAKALAAIRQQGFDKAQEFYRLRLPYDGEKH